MPLLLSYLIQKLYCVALEAIGSWEISSLEGKTCHEDWENVKASLITKKILQPPLGENIRAQWQ